MAKRLSKPALLIIDMLNTLDFPEGKTLLRQAIPVARKIAQLRERFHRAKRPVIFVNDNFSKWRSDWKEVYADCAAPGALGSELAQMLKPTPKDYFILKPKHSGFQSTALDVLLDELGVSTLVMVGIAGNICVLFTAHDGHMREFKVVVPADCVASNTPHQNRIALEQLKQGLGIATTRSASLRI